MTHKRKDLSEYQKWAYKQPYTRLLLLAEYSLAVFKLIVNLPIYILIGIVVVLHFIAESAENILYNVKQFLKNHIIKVRKIGKVVGIINCIYYLEDMERCKDKDYPLNKYWRHVPHEYFEKLEQLKNEKTK